MSDDFGFTFDPNEVDPGPQREFGPIPVGWYAAQIIEASVADTKSGNGGKVLNLTWMIVDGPQENRRVWSRHNILNPSQGAQEIGQRELRKICDGTGVGVISGASPLLNQICEIYVGKEKGNPERNEWKDARPYGNAQPAPQPAAAPPPRQPAPAAHGRAAAPAQAARPAAAGARPWGNRAVG